MLRDDIKDARCMPTKENMVDSMQWLVKDAQPHDSLFFHCKSTDIVASVPHVDRHSFRFGTWRADTRYRWGR